MTTREPERDPAARPEPGGEPEEPGQGSADEIRADRVMHPDQPHASAPDHVDADASPTPGGSTPQREETPEEPSPAPDESEGDTVTATRSDTAAVGADDRTQTLPTDTTSDTTSDTEATQVMGASGAEDRGELDRTRPMPVVSDSPPERSTDREAARARAEAKRRPLDEPAEPAGAESASAAPAVTPQPAPAPAPERQVVVRNRKHITDRFDGAVAMFILRLVTAAIMGTWGVQMLMNLDATRDFFDKTMLPYAHWAALVTAAACVLIALALIIGLLVRVAGLGVLLIAVGSLVFATWAPFHLFVKGQNGFVGEFEVLLAAVGLLFLLVGGGGWGADRMFRSNKSKGLPDFDDDEPVE